jgi:glycosyltransferase involved in cell wall biosynthesis
MSGDYDDGPNLGVVMAKYNRAETIRETLRHLAEQERDPADFEVAVVSDGAPDRMRAMIEEWMPQAPFRHQTDHEPPRCTQNHGRLPARRCPW